jgi:threonylcarbamoyladenosine tRNA methylthiotransferase MtaB
MKYSIITFGCRVNQADSLELEEALRVSGASRASPDQADLVVVNTCSVTASADQGARQTIRRIARANPSARIVVTGCYATRRPGEVGGLPNVAEVVANDDKPRLVQLLRRSETLSVALSQAEGRSASDFTPTAERFGDGEGSCGAEIEPGMAGRTAFTLRVQTGCAEPCSYCIIPSTRGRPRSVPVEEVAGEVRRVTAAGFREIVLTGVHLGSYGRDLTPPSSLYALLSALSALSTGHDRAARVLFRISSLEPMDCSPEIVALVADQACFAAHFHLPLQHASKRMLDAMRRPYTVEQYAALVDGIRARIPDASIGSDIIVGFPGETDEDFQQLAFYLEGSPLTHVHVFPYSDRSGTAASVMTGKLPGTTVRERARRLRGISEQLAARFRASQLSTVQQGLTLEDGSLVVTSNYLKVRIAAGRARNEWVNVRITGTEGPTLTGEVG